MTKVVSLSGARLERKIQAGKHFSIPLWSSPWDYERVREPGADLSPHDPILLAEQSELEVRAMLMACGIRAMPRTFVELFALTAFCEQLRDLLRALREVEESSREEASELVVNSHCGDLQELLHLLLEGRTQEAARWHLQNKTLERCTQAKVRKLEAQPSMYERIHGKPRPR